MCLPRAPFTQTKFTLWHAIAFPVVAFACNQLTFTDGHYYYLDLPDADGGRDMRALEGEECFCIGVMDFHGFDLYIAFLGMNWALFSL